jgi:hypothetical protein
MIPFSKKNARRAMKLCSFSQDSNRVTFSNSHKRIMELLHLHHHQYKQLFPKYNQTTNLKEANNNF